jgi:hypothetical protein
MDRRAARSILGSMTRRERGVRRAALCVLALYALVAVASPAFHHDVACHLTSPTHCTACTASAPAARAEAPPSVLTPGLLVAGTVAAADDRVRSHAFAVRLPARAPPA